MITKQQILDKVNVFDIYSYYLKVKDFKNKLHSPFSEDSNASFKVYKNGTFKDFSSGYQGDVFQCIAYLEKIDCKRDFNKILHKINNDMSLGLNGSSLKDKKDKIVQKNHFAVIHKKHTPESLRYWSDLGVNEDYLSKYNVKLTNKIEYVKDGLLKEFKIYKGVLGFDYVVNRKHKVYIPAIPEKKVNKQFYKNQEKEDIFGFEQLPEHCETLIITAGEKDSLVANANDYYSVSFQSETMFPEPSQIRALKEKCNLLCICYDNDENGLKQAVKISERYNLARISIPKIEGVKDIADYIPKHGKEAFNQLLEKSISDYRNNNYSYIFIQDSGYYKQEKVKGKEEYYDKQLTNFTISVIALISSETNPRRIVQIKGEHYVTEPFEFSVDAFISKNAFKKALESKGNFFFYGSDSDLMEIKKTAFAECEITREITDLGYDTNTDSYVMSNCVIKGSKKYFPDKYGIINLNDTTGLYIPASSILSSDNDKFKDSKKFKIVENVSFKEFYSLFEKVHGKHAVISMAYLMSAVNFDIVSNELNFFPLLLAFGPPRSGKSSISRTLMSIFGVPQEAVMLPNATQASISGKMAQFKNALVWMDEYDNKKVNPSIIQTLKGIYDLQGRLRKTFSNDNATYSSAVNSPCTISGQEAPHDEALLSRCIAMQYKAEKYNAEKFFAFRDLDALCKKGLGNILLELLSKRDVFKSQFKKIFNEAVDSINNRLRERKAEKTNSRLLQSYTMLMSSMIIYSEAGFNLYSQYDSKELVDIFIDQLLFQSELEQDSNEVEVFWHCFDSMIDKGVIKEGIDYRIDHNKDTLSFKALIFDSYRQYMFRSSGEWGLHKSTIQNYIKDESYYITNKATVKFKVNDFEGSTKASSAWQVCYSALPVQFHKEIPVPNFN